ncbi:MAG: hypothetical protein JWN82_376 [Candidatus Saccharibacteria bacterium]|nr:hypothetical protein [Candidatus Saccharibacteria bacterium]
MFNSLLMQFAATCKPSNFLGLVPWYKYLKLDSQCNIKEFNLLPGKAGVGSDIPLILLAVIDDLLRLAGLIAVIFVIYGGVMYATSQGNPDQASKAQSTILNALVGLAIAIVAVAFVSFIGNRLG